MAQWGLVDRVVADDQLASAVREFVDIIATKSPLGLARMKQLVNASAEQTKATGLSLELFVSALHEKSHDVAEGVRAFTRKRRPQSTGS